MLNEPHPSVVDRSNRIRELGGYLNHLAADIIEINAANGWNLTRPEDWNDTYKVPAILGLIHSEVSEALEAFRKDDCPNFAEELADVIIRVLDLTAGLHINIQTAIADKLEKNRRREYRHGGKRV